MNHQNVWLAAAALGLAAILSLAVLASVHAHREDSSDLLLGVPAGEILVSLLSVGLVAALTFADALDVRIAGTLLGAHVGYHAAAAKLR